MSASLRRTAVRGLAWGVGGKAAAIAANFAVLMVTSRALTPVEFGVFAAATIFTDLSLALASSSFGVATVQKKDLTPEERCASFYGFLGLGLALAALMAGGSWLLEDLFDAPSLQPVLCVLAVFVPLKLLAGYYGATLQRALDLRFYQLSQSLPQILAGVVTTLAAVFGAGVWSLVAGYVAATLCELGMTAIRSGRAARVGAPPSWTALRGLLNVGAGAAANRMTAFAAQSVDRLIIGALMTPAALGAYGRSYALMMAPVKLLGLAMSQVFLPVFSKMQGDDVRLGRALEEVLESQPLVYVPLGAGFALAAPLLVHVVLGGQWDSVIPMVQILFLGLFARLGFVAAEAASIAVGEAWFAVRRQAAYAIAVAAGATAGCLLNDVAAVAAGVSLALVFFYVLSLWRAVTRFRCSAAKLAIAHGRAAFVAAVCAGPAFAMQGWADRFDLLRAHQPVQAVTYGVLAGLVLTFAPPFILGEPFVKLRRSLLRGVYGKLSQRLPFLPRRVPA